MRDNRGLAGVIICRLFTVIVFLSLAGLGASLQAEPWQIRPFIKSLSGTPYQFPYLVSGLQSVHSISFEGDYTAKYSPFFDRITISKHLNDGAKRLRVLEEIQADDFGTIGHEAFHAFKANFIEAQPLYRKMKDWMKSRAPVVFPDLPEDSQEVALEEAYATFIGNTLTMVTTVGRSFAKANSDNCETVYSTFNQLWSVQWKEDIRGYYYREGIAEYWSDRAMDLWTLVREGKEAYRARRSGDGAIFAEESLGEVDKEWIAKNIFGARVSRVFDVTLAPLVAGSACAQLGVTSR